MPIRERFYHHNIQDARHYFLQSDYRLYLGQHLKQALQFYKFLEVIGIMSQTYLLNLLVVIPLMILYFVIVIVTSNRVYNKEYINKKKRIKILRDNLKYIYFEKFVKSRTK